MQTHHLSEVRVVMVRFIKEDAEGKELSDGHEVLSGKSYAYSFTPYNIAFYPSRGLRPSKRFYMTSTRGSGARDPAERFVLDVDDFYTLR